MIRRTTVDLDLELLEQARAALGCDTARATIHEALRRVLDSTGGGRVSARSAYLDLLSGWVDLEVLASRDAWR